MVICCFTVKPNLMHSQKSANSHPQTTGLFFGKPEVYVFGAWLRFSYYDAEKQLSRGSVFDGKELVRIKKGALNRKVMSPGD